MGQLELVEMILVAKNLTCAIHQIVKRDGDHVLKKHYFKLSLRLLTKIVQVNQDH